MADIVDTFEVATDFVRLETLGGLSLGPLEGAYQTLFAEVLDDGVITAEERQRLEQAADNLGLDRARLGHLEQAMLGAFESRHRVRVVEEYERVGVQPSSELDSVAALQARIAELEARVRELESELRRVQSTVAVEVDLTSLEEEPLGSELDPELAWRRLRHDPANPAALRELRLSLTSPEEAARCDFIDQSLVCLGVATEEERQRVLAQQSSVSQRPKSALIPGAWAGLAHPELEPTTGAILGIIAPAVLLGRVTVLNRDKALYQPKPDSAADPATSTVSAVRALGWAATILGLGAPAIHVDREHAGGYLHAAGLPPKSILGQAVLSGRSQTELAFLAGRHLAYYRPEHYIRTLLPAVTDLEDLFLAALTVGNPALPLATEVKRRVAPIAQALEPMLEQRQLDELRAALARFVEEGGRTNLQRWGAAVEKTACRAGLLLTGDLVAAASVLEVEAGPRSEQLLDLIAFATSSAHHRLRAELGLNG